MEGLPLEYLSLMQSFQYFTITGKCDHDVGVCTVPTSVIATYVEPVTDTILNTS